MSFTLMMYDSKCSFILNKILEILYLTVFLGISIPAFTSLWAAVGSVSVYSHMRGKLTENYTDSERRAAVAVVAALATETLHCQNKVQPTHFSYAGGS